METNQTLDDIMPIIHSEVAMDSAPPTPAYQVLAHNIPVTFGTDVSMELDEK
jgi:hypothetical protein